ncbi:MAG TPA: cytochrome c3 family protein [Pyrinomonadaceae bacterium]|nr:cytochrome c3 family protein [Pyrinomonadaceae bacterium]
MKLKLFVLLFAVAVALGVLACNSRTTPTAGLVNSSAPQPPPAPPLPDGVDPPHAVDTSGKAIPNESTTQPDKPIILAKDSDDPKSGELKPEAAFDHVKHSTLPLYGADGKTVAACVDCHHTDQPSSALGFLKKFERKEVLTTAQLEASKEPVKSCRACHFQPSAEETDEYPPASVTYPAETKRAPSGKLTNDIAYHLNCNTCHEAAKKRDAKNKAPVTCDDCHVKKG